MAAQVCQDSLNFYLYNRLHGDVEKSVWRAVHLFEEYGNL